MNKALSEWGQQPRTGQGERPQKPSELRPWLHQSWAIQHFLLGLAGKYDSITLIFCWSRLISASSCFLFSFSSRSLFCSCTFWYFMWSRFCSSSLARFSFWIDSDANFLLFCCFFCKTCGSYGIFQNEKLHLWQTSSKLELFILWQR